MDEREEVVRRIARQWVHPSFNLIETDVSQIRTAAMTSLHDNVPIFTCATFLGASTSRAPLCPGVGLPSS